MLRKWITRIMGILFGSNSELIYKRAPEPKTEDNNAVSGRIVNVEETVETQSESSGVASVSAKDICGAVHKLVIDETVEATCTTSGLTEGEHCAVCGEVLRKQEEIPALGHQIVIDTYVSLYIL